jgi:hypothetical protein
VCSQNLQNLTCTLRYRLALRPMNLKLITTFTTYTLSACTIAQASGQPTIQAARVETPPTPEDSAIFVQTAAIVTQQENATIRSIAQPESFSTTPEMLTAETQPMAPVIAITEMGAPMDTIVETQVETQSETQVAAQVNPDASYRYQAPRIEVGTRGIPTVTDLPDRVALPQDPLYPTHFETPITLGQTMDSNITTTSPITDKMADPIWSRKVEDLTAYKTAYSQNLVAWSNRVSQCLSEKPKLSVMRSDGKQLPLYFDGKEGSIVQNKDGVSVCAI